MQGAAAVVSAVAAVGLLALSTPASVTAAPVTADPGFLCGVTGGTSTPGSVAHRRESSEICAVVELPDLPGTRRHS